MQRSVNQMTATTREEGAGTPTPKGFIGKTAEKPSDVKVSKLNCSDPRLNGERKNR